MGELLGASALAGNPALVEHVGQVEPFKGQGRAFRQLVGRRGVDGQGFGLAARVIAVAAGNLA